MNEFAPAAEAFCKGRDLVTKQDDLVNFTNWCYVALRRAGTKGKPRKRSKKSRRICSRTPATPSSISTWSAFTRAARPQPKFFPPAPADPNDHETEMSFDTISYQIGNWYLYNGEPPKPRITLPGCRKEVWVTWGFVGSEIELAQHK